MSYRLSIVEASQEYLESRRNLEQTIFLEEEERKRRVHMDWVFSHLERSLKTPWAVISELESAERARRLADPCSERVRIELSGQVSSLIEAHFSSVSRAGNAVQKSIVSFTARVASMLGFKKGVEGEAAETCAELAPLASHDRVLSFSDLTLLEEQERLERLAPGAAADAFYLAFTTSALVENSGHYRKHSDTPPVPNRCYITKILEELERARRIHEAPQQNGARRENARKVSRMVPADGHADINPLSNPAHTIENSDTLAKNAAGNVSAKIAPLQIAIDTVRAGLAAM